MQLLHVFKVVEAHPALAVVGNGDLPQAKTVLAGRFQLGARIPAAFAAKTVARLLLHLPGVDGRVVEVRGVGQVLLIEHGQIELGQQGKGQQRGTGGHHFPQAMMQTRKPTMSRERASTTRAPATLPSLRAEAACSETSR